MNGMLIIPHCILAQQNMCACADAYHLYLIHTRMQKFEYLIKSRKYNVFGQTLSSVGGSGYETSARCVSLVWHFQPLT